MNLHLIDTSQCIYSGSKDFTVSRGIIEDEGKYRPREMPCGGLAYTLNVFTEWGSPEDELVFCMDRTPTIKRNLYATELSAFGSYKGARPATDKGIKVQKIMIEEVLNQMGANVVYADGCEADDVIASLVKYYKSSYEKIYIHSKDSDLFYLVDKNVEIQPLNNIDKQTVAFGDRKKISSNGKHITMNNWESIVAVDGVNCNYNTITLMKICCGDLSDSIPAAPPEMAQLILSNLPKDDRVKCGDNDFVKKYVLDITKGDRATKAIMELIQPIILKYEDVELYENDFKVNIFRAYAKAFNNKYAKLWSAQEVPIVEETIEKFIEMYNNEGGV